MKHKLFFATILTAAVMVGTAAGTMAQQAPSKAPRKQATDTAKKASSHVVVPVGKAPQKEDPAKKPIKKH
ncbi:MAG TPA: hypothetical protein VM802_12675 [Chitinophaga sp.]|uniref:hypothetical protein n=1 Tax=Chitinophaga sp. TaxID=1869181 RepID=UPI002CBAA33B|nr:hypothetical protein [Chitinophaga sp.]HVI45721.1 hypothetical protein [Chitinophaga sp.]